MATYYVSATTGNDSNNGTTIALAKATIGAGENLATSAGDVVYIAPGTYRETVTHGYSGNAANRIYFIGDPDCEIFGDAVAPGVVRVTKTDANNLPDTGATTYRVIYSGGRDYITWKNVRVDGGSRPETAYNDSNTSYGFAAQYESDNMEAINCMAQGFYYSFYRLNCRNCVGLGIIGGFRDGLHIENCVASAYYGFYYVANVINCVSIGGNYGFLYNDNVQNCTSYASNIGFRAYNNDFISDCTTYNNSYAYYGGTSTSTTVNGTISSSFFQDAYYVTNYGRQHGIKGTSCRYMWINGRDPIVGKNGSTDMQGDGLLWEEAPVALHSHNDVMKAASLLGKPSVFSEGLQGQTTTHRDSTAGATDFDGNPRKMGKIRGIYAEGASGLTTSSRDLGAFEYTNVEVTGSANSSSHAFKIEDEGIFRIPITVSASQSVTASIAAKMAGYDVHGSIASTLRPQFQLRYSQTNVSASATSAQTTTAANEYLTGSNLIIQSADAGSAVTTNAIIQSYSGLAVSGSFDKSQELELVFINRISNSIAQFSDLEIK